MIMMLQQLWIPKKQVVMLVMLKPNENVEKVIVETTNIQIKLKNWKKWVSSTFSRRDRLQQNH